MNIVHYIPLYQMPKIIPNIRERLVAELESMLQHSPDDVTIRELAIRSGVAVGTIYNYFPDKAELIRAVFERGWNATADRASAAVKAARESGGARRLDILKKVVTVVYRDSERIVQNMPARHQAIRRFTRKHMAPMSLIRRDAWRRLAEQFAPVLVDVLNVDEVRAERATLALTSSVHRLIHAFPESPEENITVLVAALNGIAVTEMEKHESSKQTD